MDSSDQSPDSAPASDWPGDEPSRFRRGLPHYLVLSSLVGASASMVLLAYLVEPDERGYGTHEQLGLAPCLLKEWTNIPCPGCGVTTSVTLAVQGHPVQAFLTQPFGLVTVLALPLLTIWAVMRHVQGVDIYRRIELRKGRWVRAGLGLMAVCWVYKLIAG